MHAACPSLSSLARTHHNTHLFGSKQHKSLLLTRVFGQWQDDVSQLHLEQRRQSACGFNHTFYFFVSECQIQERTNEDEQEGTGRQELRHPAHLHRHPGVLMNELGAIEIDSRYDHGYPHHNRHYHHHHNDQLTTAAMISATTRSRSITQTIWLLGDPTTTTTFLRSFSSLLAHSQSSYPLSRTSHSCNHD